MSKNENRVDLNVLASQETAIAQIGKDLQWVKRTVIRHQKIIEKIAEYLKKHHEYKDEEK